MLGEHKSSVRFSDEQHNCCPNYWHFSPYGFCPYGCAYCYLAGTRGVWFSPTVKVFLNLDETLAQIDRIARQAQRPTVFYLGKLQDGLALDPLTGFSRRIVPFFAGHPYARLILLTKSADVENLLPLPHGGNVVLSWSLASEGLWKHFEPGTPSPAERLAAMRRCARAGYRIRAVIMPILPVGDWADGYFALIEELLSTVPIERITMGSLCSFDTALRLAAARLGEGNPLTDLFRSAEKCPDGRRRFPRARREETYRFLLSQIRSRRPDLSPGLCLEDRDTFADLALLDSVGKCNCVL
ncbi:MAG: radical SAM protein [Planctomycetota bacterium]|nr:radical SAM protein [Planctomycetota bacterium]